MTALTRKQAIAEGYSYCGFAGEEYQTIQDISDLTVLEIEVNNYRLFEKEGTPPSVDNERLQDILADAIEENWASETNDDTFEVFEIVKNIDFTDVAERINKALAGKLNYKLTDIELLP
jgi:hypothetical protein